MFAVISSGGKQHHIKDGLKFSTETIDNVEAGQIIEIDQVLAVGDGNGMFKFGQPLVDGAKVKLEVLRLYRDKKVIVFKKKRRNDYRRKNGHRQSQIELKVLEIIG